MVGTAVNQEGRASSKVAKNLKALKPGVQTTEPPAAMDDSTAAIRPWMWNNGMIFMQVSPGARPSISPIW